MNKKDIRASDAGDMPRERLFRIGPQAFSDAELLAILLRTGAVGQPVLSFATRLLSSRGSLIGLRNIYSRSRGLARRK